MTQAVPDDQYLEHVTDMGESEAVTASEDIISAKGVKLLPKGASINKKLLSRLQQHTLDKSVDQVISIEDSIDAATMKDIAQKFLTEHEHFKAPIDFLHDRDMPIRSFARLRLNTSMRNKITVCQKQKPELFEHSLLVTFTAMCVADMMQLPRIECDDLATAAMLHDLGMMHLNEELESRDSLFTPEQERHIATHPIIMHRILNEFPEYQDVVAPLVLEHHEHLDGSGYPSAKTEDKLSLSSQILAAVECAVSVYAKHGYQYTTTVLKTHMGSQLNDDAAKCLIKILHSWYEASSDFELPRDTDHVTQLYDHLISCITSGQKITEQLANPFASTTAARHLNQRLNSMNLAMVNAGLDKFRGNSTIEMAMDEDDIIAEIGSVVQEGVFQIIDCIRVFRRQLHPESKVPPELNQWIKKSEETMKTFFLEEGL